MEFYFLYVLDILCIERSLSKYILTPNVAASVKYNCMVAIFIPCQRQIVAQMQEFKLYIYHGVDYFEGQTGKMKNSFEILNNEA